MHRLARFLDPRNTIEGKIVSVILSVVLVFSMVNLSAVVENALYVVKFLSTKNASGFRHFLHLSADPTFSSR